MAANKQKKNKEWKQRQKIVKERAKGEAAIAESRQRLEERIMAKSGYHGELRRDLPFKLSEVILAFAKPLLDDAETPAEQKQAVSFAITAWNYFTLIDSHGKEGLAIPEELLSLKKVEDPELQAVIAFLEERKRALFPEIESIIMDYECIELPGGGMHLNVVSKNRLPA